MAVFRDHGEIEVEDINLYDDPTKDVQTRTPEETPKSGLRLFRLVVLSFGVLCVLQATLNISLRLVLFEDLTRERDQLETSNKDLTRERDQLETSNNNLTRERDQLETSNNDLTRERDQLETSNNNLTRERDQLETSNKDLTREKDDLQRRLCVEDLTRERDQLETSNKDLTRERDDLQRRLCESIDGWEWFGSSCYYVSTASNTWEESRLDCISRGADLVIINSTEEQDFFYSIDKPYWIGLVRRDRNWFWVDGTPLTTAYWASGQPDDAGGHEDCAHINYRSGAHLSWNDNSCSFGFLWICETAI